jgi:4-hydroxybenzoate polyprenyltransferase
VDLDGSLIATDLCWESAMLFAANHPLEAWRLPVWLLRGRAHLKRELTARALPNPAVLPYRAEVLDFLRSEKMRGRKLILATGSEARAAESVAAHVGLFDEVLASDGITNLTGRHKLAAIEQHSGATGWGYLGNSRVDLPIWEKAPEVIVADATPKLLRAARAVCQPRAVFPRKDGRLAAWWRALRPTQWIKNVLLIVPLFAAHKLGEPGLLAQVLLAIATFCACASSVYIVNDLVDLAGDRQHPRKRLRPFASGALSISRGIIVAALLLVAAFAASALLLPGKFTALLALYLALASAYSFFFKRRLLQDVFLLAGLYTMRIMAGGAASGVEISEWLLAFSLFFFLSLAFVKRYAELLMVADHHGQQVSGRNYLTGDITLIESVGPNSGYIAVLVLCLYINSDATVGMYTHAGWLWLLCPILLYWITRMWFLARRRTLADDPVVFAVRDRVSLLAGLAAAAIFVLSR